MEVNMVERMLYMNRNGETHKVDPQIQYCFFQYIGRGL